MRWFSWVMVVVLCLVVAGALGYYKYTDIQAAIERGQAFPEPVEAVEIYKVRQISRQPSITVTGEVIARQSAELQNELKGRIVKVGFAPGSRVKRGQVLLQLDVSEERAQLAEAQADQQIARLAVNRAQRLASLGAGSVEARDQAAAQFAASGARVHALQALINKKTLTAPFDALAGLHELEVGQFLDDGTRIVELVGIADQAWIDFSLPQEHADVAVGKQVDISINQADSSTAHGNMSAEVIAKDAAVNVRSRNLRLRAVLAGAQPGAGQPPRPQLIPGMLVRVTVPLEAARLATVVPSTAVRQDAFGSAVYVLEEVHEDGQKDGQSKTRARKRSIKLQSIGDIDQSGDWVVVASGLRAGEEIAAVGAFKLHDGALVFASPANQEASARLVGH